MRILSAFLNFAFIIAAKALSIFAAFYIFAHQISSAFHFVALSYEFVAQLVTVAMLIVSAFSLFTPVVQATFIWFF